MAFSSLSLLFFITLFVVSAVAQDCYQHHTCAKCATIGNKFCGWCDGGQQPGCWPGNVTGPTNPMVVCPKGAWAYLQCPGEEIYNAIATYADAGQGDMNYYEYIIPETHDATEIIVLPGFAPSQTILASQTVVRPAINQYTWKVESNGSATILKLTNTTTPAVTAGPLYIAVYSGSSSDYTITPYTPPPKEFVGKLVKN